MTEINSYFFFTILLIRKLCLGWSIFDWCSMDWYRIIYFSSSWRCNDNNYMDGGLELTLTALPLLFDGEILYRTRLSEDMFKGLSPWMRCRTSSYQYSWMYIICSSVRFICSNLNYSRKNVYSRIKKTRVSRIHDNGTLAGAVASWIDDTTIINFDCLWCFTNESITKLFMAGVIPGLILSLLFMLYSFLVFYFPNERPANENQLG